MRCTLSSYPHLILTADGRHIFNLGFTVFKFHKVAIHNFLTLARSVFQTITIFFYNCLIINSNYFRLSLRIGYGISVFINRHQAHSHRSIESDITIGYFQAIKNVLGVNIYFFYPIDWATRFVKNRDINFAFEQANVLKIT